MRAVAFFPVDRHGTLLYDADCGICVASATWPAGRVSADRLGLLALQQVELDPRIATVVAGRPLAETIHFVRADDTVLTGARAVLAAGRLVPRLRVLAILADHRVGHFLLEPLYRQVASHRRRLARMLGLPASCPVLTRPLVVAGH